MSAEQPWGHEEPQRHVTRDPTALREAVRLMEQTGRTDEAIAWLQTRTAGGDSFALREAVALFERAGRTDEAITWLQRRAGGEPGTPSPRPGYADDRDVTDS